MFSSLMKEKIISHRSEARPGSGREVVMERSRRVREKTTMGLRPLLQAVLDTARKVARTCCQEY